MNPAGGDSGLDKILSCLRRALPELRTRYAVTSLELFGSRVRGTSSSHSDLDILVDFERPPGFFEFVALEDELGRLLDLKVDLVMKSALRPHIGQRVMAEALPVA